MPAVPWYIIILSNDISYTSIDTYILHFIKNVCTGMIIIALLLFGYRRNRQSRRWLHKQVKKYARKFARKGKEYVCLSYILQFFLRGTGSPIINSLLILHFTLSTLILVRSDLNVMLNVFIALLYSLLYANLCYSYTT